LQLLRPSPAGDSSVVAIDIFLKVVSRKSEDVSTQSGGWAMRSRRISTKKKLVAAIFVVVAATSGVAAALWSATGSGSGQARSISAVTLTVTASSGTADLFPGFTQGDLHFSIDNPNPYPVTFTSFTESGITSSDNIACPASNVTVNDGGAISVLSAANAVGAPGTIADVVTMAGAAPNGCQNKVFTITLTLAGSQS
jgi:hypothetical protein